VNPSVTDERDDPLLILTTSTSRDIIVQNAQQGTENKKSLKTIRKFCAK
jgi:hypothetical protein